MIHSRASHLPSHPRPRSRPVLIVNATTCRRHPREIVPTSSRNGSRTISIESSIHGHGAGGGSMASTPSVSLTVSAVGCEFEWVEVDHVATGRARKQPSSHSSTPSILPFNSQSQVCSVNLELHANRQVELQTRSRRLTPFRTLLRLEACVPAVHGHMHRPIQRIVEDRWPVPPPTSTPSYHTSASFACPDPAFRRESLSLR
ncbi:hypothetical protein C8Q74DRAFT_388 [Fomes fomentarius]|nr:hypothetical protein C8Q74DRAFT_388 [Fomes fomentarius]